MPQSVPQQGCPLPPQAAHFVPAPQVKAAAQVAPLQHGCPSPPHVPHAPLMHLSVGTLQVPVAPQQACPLPPQGAQRPAAHTAVASLHCWPQHGWVRAPHATHWLVVSQMDPDAQVLPQQGSPRVPHIVAASPSGPPSVAGGTSDVARPSPAGESEGRSPWTSVEASGWSQQ
jgi:hypothetical protein